MPIVDFYVGDPFNTATPKLGPLTMTAFGAGNVTLQNLSGADIVVGSYRIPAGRYINHPANQPYNVLDIEGVPGNVGPWEQWRPSGNLIVSWDGNLYAFGQRPQL